MEDSSEEEGEDPSSSGDEGDEAPGPFYTPLSGPSPHRRDQSPPPDPGTPDMSGDTPGRIRGLGRRLSKVKKQLREHWIVRQPRALSPSPDRPALPSPRPVDSTPNLTPVAPARLEEPGQALSPDPGPRGAGPLRLRSPGESAAPQHPPALGRRSRQPPARYQSEDFIPAHKVKKEGKGDHKGKK